LGVVHQLTAPYTPQENPAERANRTVKTITTQFSGTEHTRWDDWLPEISMATKNSRSESTGYSPANILYGREIRLPKSLFSEITPKSGIVKKTIEARLQRIIETS